MIPNQNIKTTISNQGKYYESIGYGILKQGTILSIPVEHLPKNSNKKVIAICDNCSIEFTRQFQLLNKSEKHLCNKCHRKEVGMKIAGNDYGKCSERIGSLHPRWNSNKEGYKKYKAEVSQYTTLYFKKELEKLKEGKLMGLCGVEGAHQVDHLISIKYGFDNNIHPSIIGHICNLSIKPWKENRKKDKGNDISIWLLISSIEMYDQLNINNIKNIRK